MSEYTWDDIIINPNSEQAKACIGKEVYFEDNPSDCLSRANKNDNCDYYILRKIEVEDNYPFVKEHNGSRWSCIIPRKKEGK